MGSKPPPIDRFPAMATPTTLRLVSEDNERFHVERDVAMRSRIIKDMLTDVGEMTDQDIPLPNVRASVLRKVLQYCEYHRADPDPTPEETVDYRKRAGRITEWDQKFMQLDQEMVFEIIFAANYLDIQGLLDLGCKTVTTKLKDKTPEEIRKMYNIKNDFTPEEEQRLKKENEWVEDGYRHPYK